MFLTILTPAYNRANTLTRLYNSLERQKNKNFEWLVVDDGSTDGTRQLVDKIKKTASIKIRYIYKNNGGKHTAVNEGIMNIYTPLTFIVDSDDYLTEDAVEAIDEKWVVYKDNSNIGSYWFLQSNSKGAIIGDKFPSDEFVSNYTEVMINSGIKGDKRSVYLTAVRKENPFPVFEGEKFIGEGIIHKQIGDTYNSVFINKVIYKGEYLEGGLSESGKTLRIKNPLGGMAISKAFLTKNVGMKYRLKKLTLYQTYGLFAKIKIQYIVKTSGNLFLAVALLPVSLFIYAHWKRLYLKKE